MLPGFSIETKPLTELEDKLLPGIIKGLSKRIGKVNAVSNKEMCAGIFKMYAVEVSEARVRKIINYIRMNNLVPGLIANGCGYYVSNDPAEIKAYIQSLIGRERAIRAVREKEQLHLNEILKRYQSSLFNK